MRKIIPFLFLTVLSINLPAQVIFGLPRKIVAPNDDVSTIIDGDNKRYVVRDVIDLKGDTLVVGKNCTLDFQGGRLSNGIIIGQGTKIEYSAPFIGEEMKFLGVRITKKSVVKDNEVFVSVKHVQSEIQTLFDISDGKPIEFSQGTYNKIAKITINTNVDANFNGSIINLIEDQEQSGTCPCFYTEPWKDNRIGFFRVHNLTIIGTNSNMSSSSTARRCIQLFYISEVLLDSINFDKFNIGKEEFVVGDMADKSRYGTSFVSIMKYDKCTINGCSVKGVKGEMFWCVPNDNPKNITYFTNNKCLSGGSSFFTIIDGRCVVTGNEAYGYNGSAFNAFCYDSEIANNKFYDGTRSCAIDLSEGTMYRAKNVYVHDNECINTKSLLWGYGEDIRVENNKWISSDTGPDSFILIQIISRKGKEIGKECIGGINNPFQAGVSQNITISNNVFVDNDSNKDHDVRVAQFYGDDISYKGNSMTGFHVPLVQWVEGRDFSYSSNLHKQSIHTYYPELLVNDGENLTVLNNQFSFVHKTHGTNNIIRVEKLKGTLQFDGNTVKDFSNTYNPHLRYVPCFVKEDKGLVRVKVFAPSEDGSMIKKEFSAKNLR